jgi:signal transduction histidine kinase
MKKLSITRRLIVSIVLMQMLLTGAVVALAMYLTIRQLNIAFDSALHGRAMSVAALVRFSEDEHPRLLFDGRLVPPSLTHDRHDMYQIIGSDGRLIAKSSNWRETASSAPSDAPYWTVHITGESFRVVRLKNIPVLDTEGPDTSDTATLTVLYAAPTTQIREQALGVAILTCIGSLLLLGIATGVSFWVVRKGLSPLSALAKSAGQVNASDWKLHASDDAHATAELMPLVAAMNEMLATLERAFTSQRSFVTNAAHELKTPIAVLKSTLQLALQKPRTAGEYRHELEAALDDVARLEALTHSMLRLARAEQVHTGQGIDKLPLIDLAETCEVTAERWRVIAQAKSVCINVESSGDPRVHGDPDDLDLIWNNLLDNAVRYSPPGAKVLMFVSRDNGHARVDVQDQGPGIRQEELRNIFERFHRADVSRSRETGGYGLGLAIARAMAQAYGGNITAESNEGSGSTFSVRLPALS